MLNSPLLILDPLSKSDLNLFVDIYTDTEVMRNIGPVLSKEKAINLFDQVVAQNDNNFFFIVRSKRVKATYGIIGLMKKHQSKPIFELGVMILNQYSNKGYAYKATNILLNYAFQKLKALSVFVRCQGRNTGANRIAQAIGFINEHITDQQNTSTAFIKWEMAFEQFEKTTKGQLN